MKNNFMEFQKRVLNLGGHFAQLRCVFDKDDLCGRPGKKYAAYVFNDDGAVRYSVIARVPDGTSLDDAELHLSVPDNLLKCDWGTIDEMYKEYIEKLVMSEVSSLVHSGQIDGATKEGHHYIENYDRYEWKLSGADLSYILEKGDEWGFWNAYYELLDRKLYENVDLIAYESDEIQNDVISHLSEDAAEIVGFPDFDLSELLQEAISMSYKPDDWNQTLKLNLMIDSGNWDYDKNCDDLLNPAQPKERLQYSSIAYIAGLLGKRTLLYAALDGNEEAKKDAFVASVFEELENNPYPNGSTMTFLVTLSLHEMLDVLDSCKGDEQAPAKVRTGIKVSKDTMCGLYNSRNGSGSLLEVKLPEDIVLPLDKVEFQYEDLPHNTYTVDQVYGLVGSAWKEAEIV